jgi:anti-sigma regulatory factor (Ser/Thr protein kinase)
LLVDLGIVASELASNAIQYAHTPFDVRIDLTQHRVLLEVTDRGEGTPSMRPEQPPRVLHGRGLRIVDALADDWGVRPTQPGPGKTVWVRMPRW